MRSIANNQKKKGATQKSAQTKVKVEEHEEASDDE